MPEYTAPEPQFMENNKYGYRVNIGNPYIYGLYVRYRKKHGIPLQFPMSDAERLDFERLVIPHLEKRFRCQAPPPNIPPRIAINIPLELLKKIYSYNRITALDIKPNSEAVDGEADSTDTEEDIKK